MIEAAVVACTQPTAPVGPQLAATTTLDLRLLGGLQVWCNGQPVREFRYEKVKALLGILGSRPGHQFDRRQVASLLWPQHATSEATRGLRNALTDLRHALRQETTDAVLTVEDRVALNLRPSRCTTDVQQLEECSRAAREPTATPAEQVALLSRATALAHGPFLDGLAIARNQPFTDWLHTQRVHFHDRIVDLHHRLIDLLLQTQQVEEAIRVASRCLALDGMGEATHRLAMRALAQGGRNTAAIDQYHRCLAMLHDEYGSLPSPETSALYRQIAEGEVGVPARHYPLQLEPVRKPERRHITVLCAVQRGALAGDSGWISVQQALARAASRFQGVVAAPTVGVAVAYFGYPVASEHAVMHAALAARAILREAADAAGVPVSCGIHTGPAVIAFDAQLPDTSALATACAHELAAQADAGACKLNGAARTTLLQRDGQAQALGLQLRGDDLVIDVPPPGAAQAGRAQAAASTPAAPFVGRDEELLVLAQAWEQARLGRAQCVLVEGDAGIGKSRLIDAACERLSLHGVPVLRFACLPDACRSPLQPILAHVRRGLRDGAPSTPAEQRMVEMFGIGTEPADDGAATPQERRLAFTQASMALLEAGGDDTSRLLVFEDLQWADPWTLELITRLSKAQPGRRRLVLCTTRPSSPGALSLTPRMTRLPLGPLSRGHADELLATFLPHSDSTWRAGLLDRCDGNPLFIRSMADWALLSGPRCAADVPHSLMALLMDRLDAVPGACDVAQLAATLGEPFAAPTLAPFLDGDVAAVGFALDQLAEQGLVEAVGEGHAFRFRHALIRDTAYAMQLKPVRQARHRAIAHHLSQQAIAAPRSAVPHEVIAVHLGAAADHAAAADHWYQGALVAIEHAADLEAAQHLGEAITCLDKVASPSRNAGHLFELHLALGCVLLRTEGMTSPRARAALMSALALVDDCTPALAQFRLRWALWLSSAEPWTSRSAGERARELLAYGTTRVECAPVLAYAHYACAMSCWFVGQYGEGARHAGLALSTARPDGQAVFRDFGIADATVLAHCAAALNECGRGDANEALSHCADAERLADDSGHSHARCCSATVAASCHLQFGDPHAAMRHAAAALQHGERDGAVLWPSWMNSANLIRALALASTGAKAAAAAVLASGSRFGGMSSASHEISRLYWAEACLRIGQVGQAARLLEETFGIASAIGNDMVLPDAHRLRGLLHELNAPSDVAGAARHYRKAIQLAELQNARLSGLRAALAMQDLYDRAGAGSQARDALARATQAFDAFEDHALLRQARALLTRESAAGRRTLPLPVAA